MTNETNIRENRALALTFFSGIAVFFWEYKEFYNFVTENSSFGRMAAVHGAVTAFFIFLCMIVKKMNADLKYPILMSIYTIMLGPIGTLTVMSIIILYMIFKRTSTDFSEWLEALFPKYLGTASERLYESIIYHQTDANESCETEPFQDIMLYGSTVQKQLAIVKMTQYYQPEFAPTLIQSLGDPQNTVRVQAASAIAKIEDQFLQKYNDYEEQLKEKPDDVNILTAFAYFCDDYANSHLLDSERAAAIREQVIEVYERCMKLMPDDLNSPIFLARIYLIAGEDQKAHELLSSCVEKTPMPLPLLTALYTESLFRLGKFNEIRQYCQDNLEEFSTMFSEQTELIDLMTMWQTGINPDHFEKGLSHVNLS